MYDVTRESEGDHGLQVTKVTVNDRAEHGRHFCSEVSEISCLLHRTIDSFPWKLI